MGRRDFVVPIGADQQKMLHLRLGHQVFEEIERGRVEPLQVVQEQGERMLGPGEHAKEPSEDQFEAALCVLTRKLRTGACSPMMSLSSGSRSTIN